MQTLEEIVHESEKMYVRTLITGIKAGLITKDHARLLCQDFLKLLPFTSTDDLLQKITNFAAQNTYFNDVKNYVESLCHEQKISGVIERMVHLMKDKKDIDGALQVANEVS